MTETWSPEILWLMFRERRDNLRMLAEMQRRAAEEPQEERRYLTDTELFVKMKIDPHSR